MASFAELLGGQSLGRLEDAGYNAPKSEREGGVSFVPARRVGVRLSEEDEVGERVLGVSELSLSSTMCCRF